MTDPTSSPHVLLSSLPPDYRDQVIVETESNLKRINATLTKALSKEKCDFSIIRRVVKWITTLAQLKHTVPPAQVRTLVRDLWRAAMLPGCSLHTQAKVFPAITLLLSAQFVGLRGTLEDPDPMQALRLLRNVHVRADHLMPLGSSSALSAHRHALLRMIDVLRWYMTPEQGTAVMAVLDPGFADVHSVNLFEAQVLLQSFFPPQLTSSTSPSQLLTNWLDIWKRIDHCPGWDLGWLVLTTRLIKHAPVDQLDLKQHGSALPSLFSRIQDSLRLQPARQTGVQTRSRPATATRLSLPNGGVQQAKAAKLAILLLSRGGTRKGESDEARDAASLVDCDAPGDEDLSLGMLHLRRVLLSTRTYFHPSNSGSHTVSLAVFLESLCAAFVRRLGRERAFLLGPGTSEAHVGKGRVATGACAPLSHADRRAFVALVLPLIEMGLYAKNRLMVSRAQSSLRHLAWVAPQTIHDRFLPAIYKALDPRNISQNHQVPAAIKALTVLIQPLLHACPLLAPHLAKLLRLALAGIDPNSTAKTLVTLVLFQVVLTWVPLVDPSALSTGFPNKALPFTHTEFATPPDGKAYTYHIDTEEGRASPQEEADHARNAMWKAGPALTEWSMLLLDRMLKSMEVSSAPAGGGSMGSQLQTAQLFGFQMLSRMLFAQLHPTLRTKARAKVVAFVTKRTLPDARKQAAALVKASAESDAQATLDALVPKLTKRILAAGTGKTDMVWSCGILGAACRKAGDAIVPHLDVINKAIDICVAHKEHVVRKAGGKLLRRVLRGLLEHYTVDCASMSELLAKKKESGDKDDLVWQSAAITWGRIVGWKDAKPRWHVPSTAERDAALALFRRHFATVHEFLESQMDGASKDSKSTSKSQTADGKAEKVDKVAWERNLRLLYQCVRGALTELRDPIPEDHEHTLAVGYVNSYEDSSGVTSSRNNTNTLDRSMHGRSQILALCTRVTRFIIAQRATDVVAHRAVIKVIRSLCASFGSSGEEGDRQMARQLWSRYTMQMMESKSIESELTWRARASAVASGDKNASGVVPERANWLVPRSSIVDAASVLHMMRVTQLGYASARAIRSLKIEAPYKEALLVLEEVSGHEWTAVRSAAQRAIDSYSNRYGWLVKARVPEWLDMLGVPFQGDDGDDMDVDSGDVSRKTRAATCTSVAGVVTNSEARDQFTARFTGLVFLLHKHRVFKWICGDWKLLGQFIRVMIFKTDQVIASISSDKRPSAQDRTQTLFSGIMQRWTAIPITSDKHVKRFHNLVHDLVSSSSSSKSKDKSADASAAGGGGVANQWKRQLMVLASLVTLQRAPDAPIGSDIDVQEINGLPSSATWKFVVRLIKSDIMPVRLSATRALFTLMRAHEVWKGLEKKSSRGEASKVEGKVRALLLDSKVLSRIADTLAEDHKSAQMGADGASGARIKWSTGVGELVNVVNRVPAWPMTRYARSGATSFVSAHANVFRVIMGLCGAPLLPLLETLLEKMMFDKDGRGDHQSRMSAAAEITAGIVRAAGDNESLVMSTAGGAQVPSPAGMAVAPVATKVKSATAAPNEPGFVAVEKESDDDDDFTPLEQAACLDMVLPKLERLAVSMSSATTSDWVDAMRYIGSGGDPSKLSPVIDVLVTGIQSAMASAQQSRLSVASGDMDAVAAPAITLASNQLRMLNSLIVELGSRCCNGGSMSVEELPEGTAARKLANKTKAKETARAVKLLGRVREQLVPTLVSSLAHPYKVVREDIARTLVCLMNSYAGGFVSSDSKMDGAWLVKAAQDLKQQVTYDGSVKTNSSNEDKDQAHTLYTVMNVVLFALTSSDAYVYGQVVLELVPCVLVAQGHPELELAKTAKGVGELVSRALRLHEPVRDQRGVTVNDVVASLIAGCTSPHWRQRAAAVRLLGNFTSHHALVISVASMSKARKVMNKMLSDSQIDAQTEACTALTGSWAATPSHSATMASFLKRYRKKSLTKLPKIFSRSGREAALAAGKHVKEEREKASKDVEIRHAAMLGLSTLVLAFPYEITECGPTAVILLTRFVNDPAPVGKTAANALSEFKRTHQDGWELHKQKFTVDQLMELDGLLTSPSYYA